MPAARFVRPTAFVLAALLILPVFATAAAPSPGTVPGLLARVLPIKPVRSTVAEQHLPDVITVKLRDGLAVDAAGGVLVATAIDLDGDPLAAAAPALAGPARGRWERAYDIPRERLAGMRGTAEVALGKALPDLAQQYNLFLDDDTDAVAALDALNALDIVEIALPLPRPVAPPVPGNFQPSQGYQNAAPAGIGAEIVWASSGARGAGVEITDVEYDWNLDHQDLPATTIIGPTPVNPFEDDHHGTAVLGQVGSIDNGWGTTGIAPDADFSVSGSYNGSVWDVGAAIIRAVNVLEAGDVIILEQQLGGPNGEFAPVEWFLPWYNAIVTAVGNGIVIVEAAGNGNEDLDGPAYSTGNGGHWPFLAQNDSGAIIVGAGAPGTGGGGTPGSRLSFSNYGETVDLQGWGSGVWTTGYGGSYASEGFDLYYTSSFGGTSSASPIVAGAVALLQSAWMAETGTVLTPAEVRSLLRDTGVPQANGSFPASQNIGPRPDVPAAIALALLSCEPTTDCNANGVLDECDVNAGTSFDCNANGIPDECDIQALASDDCNTNGVPDDCEVDGTFDAMSIDFAPLDSGTDHTFVVSAAPAALGDVVLTVTARGDLDQTFETVNVRLNGDLLGSAFSAGATDCEDPASTDVLLVPAATFNALVPSGTDASFELDANGFVSSAQCPGLTFVRLEVSYPSMPPNDANGNGVPDDCDPATCAGDLDADGSVGFGDLNTLLADWGPCPSPCSSDLNDDAAVGFGDLNVLLGAWGACSPE